MSGKNPASPPPSLAGHFEAPDGYMGHFGWLCGYSADAPFLNDALTRFTGLTIAQRAALGRIFLAAVLDRGNPPLPLTDVPGVAHLPLTGDADGHPPFRLLHAKVALLGFRHLTDPGRWQVRLLVSTGNWTRQTLEESLDLIWRLDLPAGEAAATPVTPKSLEPRDCADVRAAWGLLSWLLDHANTSLLSAGAPGRPGAARLAEREVRGWLDACQARAEGRPRFFDSRRAPLLDRVLEILGEHAPSQRSYLAMGSGFYEGEGNAATDLVPLAILRKLRERGLLRAQSEVDVFVDPGACQALAAPQARDALKSHGVCLRPAAAPEAIFGARAQERSLHAKFLFGATARNGAFTNAWLYLGSGNLTRPGFLNRMSATGGNLEAGVLLFPAGVFLRSEKEAAGRDAEEPGRLMTRLLPVQWEKKISGADALAAGAPKVERPDFPPPPVTWLLWDDTEGAPVLRAVERSAVAFTLLDAQGTPCPGEGGVFPWPWPRPALVTIRWRTADKVEEAQIPVVDKWGRAAARELPALDTEQAWDELAAFPLPPEEDEEEAGDGPGGSGGAPETKPGEGANHPIRRMMELVENIAGRQVSLPEADWKLWCLLLEQTLIQARGSAAVAYFRDELGEDPLWPLLAPCFRPEFAEDGESENGRLYEAALGAVRTSWGVAGLPGLGGTGREATHGGTQARAPGGGRLPRGRRSRMGRGTAAKGAEER